MTNTSINSGITLDCTVFNESIGAEKDLILINYSDFDFDQTMSIYNRQTDDSYGNLRGLTDIFLKPGGIKHIFEGTDYSVIPTVTPEVREDGNLWYTHSLAFTVYSKLAKDRETLITLGKSTVIAVTKDRSTGFYELFGAYQGLKVSGIDRSYTGSQASNFYQVTIATPEINVVKEPSLSELSLLLDGGTILPPAPTPGVYGDATPTVQGLVRVDSIEVNPIVYLKATVDSLFARKDNILTTEALLEANKTSTVKWPAAKAIVDWITSRFELKITASDTTKYWRGDKTWQTLDKNSVGLGNVDNTADADKPITDAMLIALENKADLVDGKVPASQLPSYISDVLEFPDLASFPVTGLANTLYVAISPSNFQYRWSGSTYIQITNGSIASTDDVPEGLTNLYFTVTRFLANLTFARIVAALGFTPEDVSNKQDSLAYDGTGTKFPTVDAINALALSLSSDLYVEKKESETVIIDYGAITTIEQIVITDNKFSVLLQGDATVVKSVQLSGLYIRMGKPHFFKNDTGHDVTIKHLTGTGNIKYFFPDGLDLVVKDQELIQFITNANDSSDVRLEHVGGSINLDDYYTKSETDALVVGLLDLRGVHDASSNLFPTVGGSGASGVVLKGDLWYVSVAGILSGKPVAIGDSFFALVDSPGQTAGNWSVFETNIGYVPEDTANKTATIIGNESSTTLFPNILGAVTYFQQKLTDSIFGSFITSLTAKVTIVDADTSVVSDSADSGKAKKVTWLNIFNYVNSKIEIPLSYACSDEVSDLAVGTLITFRMPCGLTLSNVKLSLNVAPTVTKVIVDIKKNGTSIFSTLISVDTSQTTSVGASVPAVISDTNLVDDSIITISTTQVGSSVAGKGLKVTFLGKKI